MRMSRIVTATLASAALLANSTAFAATQVSAPAASPSAWTALTALSGVGVGLGGAAAAQPMDAPPDAHERGSTAPHGEIVAMLPLFVLILLAVFATGDDDGPEAISPN